jgi:hypothetical protein
MMDVNNKPLHFALFKAEIQGVNAYITEKGLTYVFEKAEEEEHHREKVILTGPEEESIKLEMARVNLNLEGT